MKAGRRYGGRAGTPINLKLPARPQKPPHLVRPCAMCGGSLQDKQSNAQFCSEACRRKKHAARRRQRASEWKAHHPLEVWAHKATAAAVQRGLIVPQPCEVCGTTPTDAHHEDYARPLEVNWLCRRHHRVKHRELTEAQP